MSLDGDFHIFEICAVKILDIGTQTVREGVNIDSTCRSTGLRDLVRQNALTVFQILQFGAKLLRVYAGNNRVDAVIDLGFDGNKLILFCGNVNGTGGFIVFIGDMLGEGMEIRLRGQAFFYGINHGRLQLVSTNRETMTSVRLIAFFITPPAGVILVFVAFTLGRIGNIFRAAFAALDQTGEQENAPCGRADFAVLVFVILQTVLHSKPNLHIDNRGDSTVNAYLSRIRFPANIFPHDLVCIFIPDINPCVAGILKHIVKGIFVHGLPFPADDAGDVQLVHNVIIGISTIIQIERLADKLGFGRNNHISLVFDGISIGRIAAKEFPFAGGGGNTVHRFLPRLQYHVLPEADGDKLP